MLFFSIHEKHFAPNLLNIRVTCSMIKYIYLSSFCYHLQVAYFLAMLCSERKYCICFVSVLLSADDEIFLRGKGMNPGLILQSQISLSHLHTNSFPVLGKLGRMTVFYWPTVGLRSPFSLSVNKEKVCMFWCLWLWLVATRKCHHNIAGIWKYICVCALCHQAYLSLHPPTPLHLDSPLLHLVLWIRPHRCWTSDLSGNTHTGSELEGLSLSPFAQPVPHLSCQPLWNATKDTGVPKVSLVHSACIFVFQLLFLVPLCDVPLGFCAQRLGCATCLQTQIQTAVQQLG